MIVKVKQKKSRFMHGMAAIVLVDMSIALFFGFFEDYTKALDPILVCLDQLPTSIPYLATYAFSEITFKKIYYSTGIISIFIPFIVVFLDLNAKRRDSTFIKENVLNFYIYSLAALAFSAFFIYLVYFYKISHIESRLAAVGGRANVMTQWLLNGPFSLGLALSFYNVAIYACICAALLLFIDANRNL